MLLHRAAHEGTPLVDGDTATFVWTGDEAPQLLGDFGPGLWSECALPLTRVGEGIWTASLRLPADAYVEYVYLRGGWRVPDPFNRREVSNGLGGANNFFYMPEGQQTPLAERRPGVPSGTLKRHALRGGHFIVGEERAVYLYQPPVKEPVPLVVVFDGDEYRRRARLHVIVENLIAERRIRPVALAMVAHGGSSRLLEYACNDGTVAFVTEKVLPLAREQMNLLDPSEQPGAFGVAGASMGGLMALYTALRAPEVFGSVICQSGTFLASVFGRDPVVFELARQRATHPSRVWMDAGNFETLIAANRRMCDTLLAGGHDATCRAYNGGHNYSAWRDDVWRGLEALYGDNGDNGDKGRFAAAGTEGTESTEGPEDRSAASVGTLVIPATTATTGEKSEKTLIARMRGSRRRRAHAREDGPHATGD